MNTIFHFYEKALENLRSFSGSGLIVELTFLCILYLLFRIDDDRKKHALVYYPVAVIIVYFIPIWAVFTELRNDSEILYRILWLVPMGVIVAFAFVAMLSKVSERNRGKCFIGLLLLIMLSGRYVYKSEFYSRAENIYHVPDTVVKICDEIEVPGREIRACFPEELVSYVRQYSSVVFLTYGRASLITNFREVSTVQDILKEDIIDTEALAGELRNRNTPYLIISSDKIFDKSLWDYDFAYVTTIDGYDIYLDNTAYIGLFEEEENG